MNATTLVKSLLSEAKMPPKDPSAVAIPPKRFRRPDQRQYAALVKRTGTALDRLARRLAAGDVTLAQYDEQAKDILREGHLLASVAGRRRAGDPALTDPVDALRAAVIMRDEARYFSAFVDQVRGKDPRYVADDNAIQWESVAQRSRAYLPRMRVTANQAFVDTSPIGMLFDWAMLGSEHCTVCPSRQDNSPYTSVTLPGMPGDGKTPCRHHCKCVLVRHDGVIGFAPVGWQIPKLKPGDVGDPNAIPIIDIDLTDPYDLSLLNEFFVDGAIPTV